jgi:hypothetical protein
MMRYVPPVTTLLVFVLFQRRRTLLFPLGLAVVTFAASPAWSYAGFKFQRYYSQSTDIDGAEPGNGMAVDFGIGRGLGVEFSVGWFTTDIPASTVGSSLDVGLLIMPVTMSAFAAQEVGVGGVYALGGVGIYITDSFHGLDVEERVTPGFQFGGGFWIWRLGLDARYIFASPEIAGEERSIDGLVIGVLVTFR